MIKAIITDVDGVIIGKQKGINFPLPNPEIMHALRRLRGEGYPTVLCSARLNTAIIPIVTELHLDNPHITDGGALIINPMKKSIIEKHAIDKHVAKEIIIICLRNDIYIELFGLQNYYIQKFDEKRTPLRTVIQQKDPVVVSSLLTILEKEEIIKIICHDPNLQKLDNLFALFHQKVTSIKSTHPLSGPLKYLVFTRLGVSKKQAARTVAKFLGIALQDFLGIGDSRDDWNFMEDCGYAATTVDAEDSLKNAVLTKGKNNSYIAKSVEENGFLDIISYFFHR